MCFTKGDNYKAVKILAVITIICGLGVIATSLRILFLPGQSQFRWSPWPNPDETVQVEEEGPNGDLKSDGSEAEAETEDEADSSSQNIFEISKYLKNIVAASVGAGGLAAIVQILLSCIVICASNENLKSRLKAWEALNFVTLLINATSALVPFTFDLETDSFIGINTFGNYLLSGGNYEGNQGDWRTLSTLNKDADESIQQETMPNLIRTQFPIFSVALGLNIICSFSFLIVNAFWLCCCGGDADGGTEASRDIRGDHLEEDETVIGSGGGSGGWRGPALPGPDVISH